MFGDFWQENKETHFGRTLLDLLRETISAIDSELMKSQNLEYREELVVTAYQLRGLANTHIQSSHHETLDQAEFHVSMN